MKTLFIDGRDYETPRALHESLQRLLALPAYYCMNADALHDCLAEKGEKVNLIVFNPGSEDVAAALGEGERRVAAALPDDGFQRAVVYTRPSVLSGRALRDGVADDTSVEVADMEDFEGIGVAEFTDYRLAGELAG